jgi:hypothetical protein
VSNITLTRRRNALALFQEYAERALAGGTAPKGLEQAFATKLQVSPSMWSQIKSARPIGDKLARQIETHCAVPNGWLDRERDAPALTAAEKAFLDLALRAWRNTNAAGRRELRARWQAGVASRSNAEADGVSSAELRSAAGRRPRTRSASD